MIALCATKSSGGTRRVILTSFIGVASAKQ
jgi:hypothetical protein